MCKPVRIGPHGGLSLKMVTSITAAVRNSCPAIYMKNATFWDVTTCISCKNRRFGGKYRRYRQCDKNRRVMNNVTSVNSCHPDDGGATFLQNLSSYKNHT
jgi:hypothetical protein